MQLVSPISRLARWKVEERERRPRRPEKACVGTACVGTGAFARPAKRSAARTTTTLASHVSRLKRNWNVPISPNAWC